MRRDDRLGGGREWAGRRAPGRAAARPRTQGARARALAGGDASARRDRGDAARRRPARRRRMGGRRMRRGDLRRRRAPRVRAGRDRCGRRGQARRGGRPLRAAPLHPLQRRRGLGAGPSRRAAEGLPRRQAPRRAAAGAARHALDDPALRPPHRRDGDRPDQHRAAARHARDAEPRRRRAGHRRRARARPSRAPGRARDRRRPARRRRARRDRAGAAAARALQRARRRAAGQPGARSGDARARRLSARRRRRLRGRRAAAAGPGRQRGSGARHPVGISAPALAGLKGYSTERSPPMLSVPHAVPREVRGLPRRRVYLGEGLTFEVSCRGRTIAAEAVDLTLEGLGLALTRVPLMPLEGEVVSVRYTGRGAIGATQEAVVAHAGSLRSGARVLPRIGLALLGEHAHDAGVRWPCPDALPAFAVAACPWFYREHARFRVLALGAYGMTLQAEHTALLRGIELDFEVHLPFVGVQTARGRMLSARDVAWIDPPRTLHNAFSRYLLAGDDALTPARLRAGGLHVGSIEPAVGFGYASTTADHEAILALRLHAHQAEGHLRDATVD